MATRFPKHWIETEREAPGKWIGAVPSISGCHVYGKTKQDAVEKVEALALRIALECLENGEPLPGVFGQFFANAVAA